MKRIVLSSLGIVAVLAVLINFSCSKSNNSIPNNNSTATDSVLLNIGNNIILPNYQSASAAANALDSGISMFNANPNSANLANVQMLFKTAYTALQSISECNYNCGPASNQQSVLSALNIFPTADSLIEVNISNGNYNINSFGNTVAKGFPALDYLLFYANNNTTIIANYTTNANAANRQKYLAAVSADIKTEINAVTNGWLASGGNYIQTFLTGTGNSTSSSLGLLLNSMDQDFEILKNDRLGIPLGKIPVGSNLPLTPNEVEAYYSGISVQLALAQLKAVQGIYLGTAANGNGKGINDYLVQAEQKNSSLKYNGGLLSDTIKAHFTTAIATLQAIPNPLSANLNNANAVAAFEQCQELVTLLKTDLPSDLGVLINYGDNDGD